MMVKEVWRIMGSISFSDECTFVDRNVYQKMLETDQISTRKYFLKNPFRLLIKQIWLGILVNYIVDILFIDDNLIVVLYLELFQKYIVVPKIQEIMRKVCLLVFQENVPLRFSGVNF